MEKITATRSLRYAMLLPLALMFASVISCCFGYSRTKHRLTQDLNGAISSLAKEYADFWTAPDTIAAMRQMDATPATPIIYKASSVNFENRLLRENAYYSIAIVEGDVDADSRFGAMIESDSVLIVPQSASSGLAIKVQGFADCSMASVFISSDHGLPALLFTLSVLTAGTAVVWRKKRQHPSSLATLESIRLTPMQKQLAMLLLHSPCHKVSKHDLCIALWGNKDNAEESLYTLVRRTKKALSEIGIDIICNRGESYELRINQ